jgi:DNA-binding transcriptional MerR regulator
MWERRYGLLTPTRTDGGHRVYGADDVARVKALLQLMESGLPVGAAVAELSERPAEPDADAHELFAEAWTAADALDPLGFRRAVAEAVTSLGPPRGLDAVVAPLLRRMGDEWRASPRNVAREHLASMIVRSYLLEQLAAMVRGSGPRALGFCPEGELHDIGLVMAGVALADAGWLPLVLGAETPLATIDVLVGELRPDAVVVASQRRGPALRFLDRWTPPPKTAIVLGGGGFLPEDAQRFRRCVVYAGAFAELAGAMSATSR